MSVLDLLRTSSTGLTQEEVVAKAIENDIPKDTIFTELGNLITEGFARFDENPKPGRFKATNKAWAAG